MKWKPKKLFRKSAFRQHLILFLITILIPALIFLSYNLYRSSKQLTNGIENASVNDLDRIGRNLDNLNNNVDQLATQLSLTPSIYDLLTQPYKLSIYDYSIIKEQLRGWTTSNSIFYSLLLHIYQNDKVLTTNEGLYGTSEYYDSAFITKLREAATERHTSWTGIRVTKGGVGSPDMDVLSFARSIPATSHTPLGMLVIDIQKDSFIKSVLHSSTIANEHTLVIDPQNKLVSPLLKG